MRTTVSLATAVLLGLGPGGTAPAHAHTDVLAVWPDDGARVAAPLEQVAVRFVADVVPGRSVVRVECGDRDAAGALRTVGADLVAPVHGAAPGEGCRMEFSALAVDGHRIVGTTTFVMSGPGRPGEAAPRWVRQAAQGGASTRRSGPGRTQPELWVLGLGLGALAFALLRGRGAPHPTRSGPSQSSRSGQ